MRQNPSSLHLFLTLFLLAGLLFGAFGQTLVSALEVNANVVGENSAIPVPVSFTRQNPASSPTNADTLTFRVTFSGNVSDVDATDFVVHDNTPDSTTNAPGLTVTMVSNRIYDVRIYGGNLDFFTGKVGLDFSTIAAITDTSSNPIVISEPPIDETYLVDNSNPTLTITQAAGQIDPAKTQPVNFQVVFSEAIDANTFRSSDITQGGDAPSITWIITRVNNKTFNLSATTTGNGSIIPLMLAGRVLDSAGNGNDPFIAPCKPPPDPPIDPLFPGVPAQDDHCVMLDDDIQPAVIIEQGPTQIDPTNEYPVKFTVVFSEIINDDTFTTSDITQAGTAPSPVWEKNDADNDNRTFELTVTSVSGNGTIVPVILAGSVKDLVGNDNTLSQSIDNSVEFRDIEGPTVTIEQASGQTDPAYSLPIRFTVKFSEKIDPNTFTKADIIQNGGATNILWGISSSNNITFTLTAISSSYGFLEPSIDIGRVKDIFGNLNTTASTSTDNIVGYRRADSTETPTPTATSSQGEHKSVVITEVAWMGSAASSSDEWIELYNTTNSLINMDGWHLRSYRYNGRDFSLNLDIVFTAEDIIQPRASTDPKDTSGYFLLERGFSPTDDNAVMNIDADKIYTNFLLSDSGEILLLCSRKNITNGSCNINQKRLVVDFVNGSLTGSGGINPWPAGKGSPIFGSMERKFLLSDANEHWFTHVAVSPRYGRDRNWDGSSTGNILNGTPKHPNWAFEVTATPRPTITPTRTPTRRPVSAVPILVINEVLARAGSDWNNDGKVDVYDEFIEVINAGTVNVNLNNYKLDDELNLGSALYALPNQTLKPGEMTVFYGSQTGIHLEDSGDTARLIRSSNNAVVDAIAYPLVKTVDSSICRYTDGYGSWIKGCFPTPGRPNALAGDRYPSTSNGNPIPVCFLPDSVPEEFVLAECGEDGLGIWNNSYWDSFPGEGKETWLVDDNDKWPVVYQ